MRIDIIREKKRERERVYLTTGWFYFKGTTNNSISTFFVFQIYSIFIFFLNRVAAHSDDNLAST